MISTHISCDHNTYHIRFRDTWLQREKEATRPFTFQPKALEMFENQYKSELLIRSHPRGRRFDPVQVHQEQGKRLCRLPCFYVKSRIGAGDQARRPLKALSGKMTKKKRGSFFCAFSVFKLNLLGRRFKTEKPGGSGGACVQSLCPAKAEKFHKTEIAFFPQLC